MTATIACFGAAHIDHKAHAAEAVRFGTSNPVSVIRSLGGVARNVAEGLARLECRVALVSRLGSDGDGDGVLGDMARLGVDKIGRESCRERVCQFVYISVVAVSLKKERIQYD